MFSVSIDTKGTARFIYHDELRPLLAIGSAKIERASHVEPNAEGQWGADMRPVNGPWLGPFETRAEALRAETAWIETNVL